MNYKPIKINFIPMFYRLNKNGKCVIKCRLRHNDEKIEFSTGIFIIPESWNRKNQNVHPPNQENDIINSELSLIKNKLNQAFFINLIYPPMFFVYILFSKKLNRYYIGFSANLYPQPDQ